MTNKATKLAMHEQLMLMALRDEEGTLESRAGMHEFALGGAILAELVLAGRVTIEDDKKRLVDLVDRSSLNEAFLDEALELIANAKRRRRADNWVYRIASIKKLRHRIAQQLCRRGILKESEDKVLWLFTRKIYPEIDSRPEDQLIEQLRQAIFETDTKVPARTAIVLSLAHATGMLEIHFDKKDLKQRKKRIEQISSGQAVGEATKATVQAVQVAMMAAQSAAAISVITTTVVTR
jgi:hypothetical protein